MKIQSFLYTLLIALMSAAFIACNEDNTIPPSKEEETPEVPETPEDNEPTKEVVPETPYEYDPDMDYDSEAYLAAYKGTPYPQAHAVPGTIEAEDFDDGDNKEAWYESDTKGADTGYRGKHDVDVRGDGSASNGYYIGDVQPGEWICYTLDVAEDGAYSIDTYIIKGDGSEGSFYFEVDGRGATQAIAMPLGGWTDFTHKVTATGLQLTKGKHILKYYANTPGNVDKFVLTRTGELETTDSRYSYPMTKTMGNPLFVDFPSPMYNSWMTGPLYTADASAHVWNINGREVLYVYASHDMEPALGCDRMDRYHVFSTEDMKTWTDHGEIMNAATVKKQAGWGCDGFMWAPDCAYNPENETYYFYFPHPSNTANWNKTWRVGVAVSKSPDKDFSVIGYIEGMPAEIDPSVFVDDDGQAYIYNGGGGNCYGGKLKKNDWTKLDGAVKKMEGLDDFHEAAWIHKYNGKYYLSHSDNNPTDKGGNRMKYAESDSPLGPWTYKGVYMYPTGIDTNHGSIVKFKGQWYAFYHTGNYSGEGNLRSVCVDPITIQSDGTLEVVRNWGTSFLGTQPSVSQDTPLTLEAEEFNEGGYHYAYFRHDTKDEPEIATQGTATYVAGLKQGEWARYSFTAKDAGKYSVECKLAATTSNSKFVVSVNGERPASNGIDISGSTGQWTTVTVKDLEVPAGDAYLEFRVMGGTVNADSFVIKKQ